MGIWTADLSDYSIGAFVNKGEGLVEDGVMHTEDGIDFEVDFPEGIYPMFAVNFRDYLEQNGMHIEDMSRFVLLATAYDEVGEEVDLSIEYEKFAFVSEDALDGYSGSDILPTGNYKAFGSTTKTTFDLTKYTGFKSDGTSLSDYDLEDGVGFNIQLMNGEIDRVKHLMLKELIFYTKDND